MRDGATFHRKEMCLATPCFIYLRKSLYLQRHLPTFISRSNEMFEEAQYNKRNTNYVRNVSEDISRNLDRMNNCILKATAFEAYLFDGLEQ